jgi:hypothetical protein
LAAVNAAWTTLPEVIMGVTWRPGEDGLGRRQSPGNALNDYLGGILRPTITKDYRRTLQELESEIAGADTEK